MTEYIPAGYDPQPGDIFITTIHGNVGAGIAAAEALLQRIQHWQTRVDTKWRHAGVYLGDGLLIEAEPGGARIASLSEYDHDPVLWLRCPAVLRASVVSSARTMKGVPYSFADYLAIVDHDLHIPFPGLKDFIADSGHEMCSALVDRAAMLGGWHLFTDDRWEGYVSPIELAQLALAQPPLPGS